MFGTGTLDATTVVKENVCQNVSLAAAQILTTPTHQGR
jgi:hypothetical protein